MAAVVIDKQVNDRFVPKPLFRTRQIPKDRVIAQLENDLIQIRSREKHSAIAFRHDIIGIIPQGGVVDQFFVRIIADKIFAGA